MEIEVAILWIIEIVVISLSIILASVIARKLYEENWKKEKRERFVSDVLAPLIMELDGNIGRIESLEPVEGATGDYLVTFRQWRSIRKNPMWRFLAKSGIRSRIEELLSEVEQIGFQWKAARSQFKKLSVGVFSEMVFEMDTEDTPMEDRIAGLLITLILDGWRIYLDEGWTKVAEVYSRMVDDAIRNFGERGEPVRVTSGDDVVAVMGSRIEKDYSLVRFKKLREKVLEEGEEVSALLHLWEKDRLSTLYGGVV
jgi:hypothetical protein